MPRTPRSSGRRPTGWGRASADSTRRAKQSAFSRRAPSLATLAIAACRSRTAASANGRRNAVASGASSTLRAKPRSKQQRSLLHASVAKSRRRRRCRESRSPVRTADRRRRDTCRPGGSREMLKVGCAFFVGTASGALAIACAQPMTRAYAAKVADERRFAHEVMRRSEFLVALRVAIRPFAAETLRGSPRSSRRCSERRCCASVSRAAAPRS